MNNKTATKKEADAKLITGLLADDPTCWETFFDRFSGLIISCITRTTWQYAAIITQQDVEEIFGNVLINLLQRDKSRLRVFDPARGRSLSTWIGLIAVNTAIDYLRALSRQPAADPSQQVSDQPALGTDPYKTTLAREQLDLISHIFGSLSARDRLFVHLYYYEERDPLDVAKIMGISVKTVYSKKYKLRHRLSQQLGES